MSEKKNDEGFMLIELLVTIAIMGIILSVISAIVFAVFDSKRRSNEALQNSNDMQVVATYFADDVQGATTAPLATNLTAGLEIEGKSFDSSYAETEWTHTYSLNSSTHELSRDGQVIASNVYSADFAPSASIWTLTITGCALPVCATASTTAPAQITATRRIG